MRQSRWIPSIIPDGTAQSVYLVLDDFGRHGRAWRESDVEATGLETVIADMLEGQYSDPVRVVGFHTGEGWARDVSEDVAEELRRRCDLQGRDVPAHLDGFMDRHEHRQDRAQLRLVEAASATYLPVMPRSPYLPCIPTRGTAVPSHPDWIHEVKPDGFRLIVARDDARVRLFTRNGHDWTKRYPLIVEAAQRMRQSQFVLDGEAVLLDLRGISDFDGLMSHKHDDEVQLYAFDVLALDGEDLRKLPLQLRKTNLQRLLARRADGIHLAPFETGEIGPDLFKAACDMMLEGLVSKRKNSRYRAGPSKRLGKSEEQGTPGHPQDKGQFRLTDRIFFELNAMLDRVGLLEARPSNRCPGHHIDLPSPAGASW